MVLSVKKTLAVVMCVSTLGASETMQTSALRTRPRRGLTGIHHMVKYAPNVVEQPKGEPNDKKDDDCSDSKESEESYDSYDLQDKESLEMNLKDSEEMELDVSQDVDVDIDGPVDLNVQLKDGEGLEYDGDDSQVLSMSSSGALDFVAMAQLNWNDQLESELNFKDGTLDLELDEDEDYQQDLDFEDDEEVDEFIAVPTGATSIRLRMHKGNVDLDIIKGVTTMKEQPDEMQKKEKKIEETQKKEKTEETQKKKKAEETQTKKDKDAVSNTATKEQTVSYAAEAKDWIQNNRTKPAFLGGLIGAAVGIVGVAGVAIAKSWKRASKSVLAEDVSADAEANAEMDEDNVSVSDSESDSDEDVEADVTEESAVEEKKASVVEGSV